MADNLSVSDGYDYSGQTAGNAVLYLVGSSGILSNTQSNISSISGTYGSVVQHPFNLWLTSIQTGSALQFVKQTTQTRYAYEPIRRAEMTCVFTAVWPVRLINEMNNFSEALRQHYFYALANATPIPMTLIYLSTRVNQSSLDPGSNAANSPMSFQGWVKAAPSGFQRFQSLFSRTFSMQVLTQPSNDNTIDPSVVTKNTAYLPSAADAESYTGGWYTASANGPKLSQISGIN